MKESLKNRAAYAIIGENSELIILDAEWNDEPVYESEAFAVEDFTDEQLDATLANLGLQRTHGTWREDSEIRVAVA